MISPSTAVGPRPIGHTTITKQPAGLRIQGTTATPRLVNAQIRGPIHQQGSAQLQTMAGQSVSILIDIFQLKI